MADERRGQHLEDPNMANAQSIADSRRARVARDRLNRIQERLYQEQLKQAQAANRRPTGPNTSKFGRVMEMGKAVARAPKNLLSMAGDPRKVEQTFGTMKKGLAQGLIGATPLGPLDQYFGFSDRLSGMVSRRSQASSRYSQMNSQAQSFQGGFSTRNPAPAGKFRSPMPLPQQAGQSKKPHWTQVASPEYRRQVAKLQEIEVQEREKAQKKVRQKKIRTEIPKQILEEDKLRNKIERKTGSKSSREIEKDLKAERKVQEKADPSLAVSRTGKSSDPTLEKMYELMLQDRKEKAQEKKDQEERDRIAEEQLKIQKWMQRMMKLQTYLPQIKKGYQALKSKGLIEKWTGGRKGVLSEEERMNLAEQQVMGQRHKESVDLRQKFLRSRKTGADLPLPFGMGSKRSKADWNQIEENYRKKFLAKEKAAQTPTTPTGEKSSLMQMSQRGTPEFMKAAKTKTMRVVAEKVTILDKSDKKKIEGKTEQFQRSKMEPRKKKRIMDKGGGGPDLGGGGGLLGAGGIATLATALGVALTGYLAMSGANKGGEILKKGQMPGAKGMKKMGGDTTVNMVTQMQARGSGMLGNIVTLGGLAGNSEEMSKGINLMGDTIATAVGNPREALGIGRKTAVGKAMDQANPAYQAMQAKNLAQGYTLSFRDKGVGEYDEVRKKYEQITGKKWKKGAEKEVQALVASGKWNAPGGDLSKVPPPEKSDTQKRYEEITGKKWGPGAEEEVKKLVASGKWNEPVTPAAEKKAAEPVKAKEPEKSKEPEKVKEPEKPKAAEVVTPASVLTGGAKDQKEKKEGEKQAEIIGAQIGAEVATYLSRFAASKERDDKQSQAKETASAGDMKELAAIGESLAKKGGFAFNPAAATGSGSMEVTKPKVGETSPIGGMGTRATEEIKTKGLGAISQKYESGKMGAGAVSSGKGDFGGASYGTYQFASKGKGGGRVMEFLKASGYASQFEGLKPGTPEFNAKWKELASADPKFGESQHEFIKKTHFDPQAKMLAEEMGLDVSKRSRAVQEAVWSVGVQHGPGSKLIKKALKGKDASKMSDKELIQAIYAERGKKDATGALSYFRSSSANVQAGVAKRYDREQQDLMAMLESEGKTPQQGSPEAAKMASVASPGDQKALESVRPTAVPKSRADNVEKPSTRAYQIAMEPPAKNLAPGTLGSGQTTPLAPAQPAPPINRPGNPNQAPSRRMGIEDPDLWFINLVSFDV